MKTLVNTSTTVLKQYPEYLLRTEYYRGGEEAYFLISSDGKLLHNLDTNASSYVEYIIGICRREDSFFGETTFENK